ncbi:uncharacterized protein DUF4244 [Nocardia puris]|uniref:Uncharacterized protein DUF4244 n=2 Tax=Nocardia puris TaxID=208602 RepID=A0A366DCT3_9NOCA|nr:uncharacterized protein DUF4244 [Nocardia puris]
MVRPRGGLVWLPHRDAPEKTGEVRTAGPRARPLNKRNPAVRRMRVLILRAKRRFRRTDPRAVARAGNSEHGAAERNPQARAVRLVLAVKMFPARLQARILRLSIADEGMSTAEYAIGTIAAAAFGAILYTVVTGDSIVNALTRIIDRALNTSV